AAVGEAAVDADDAMLGAVDDLDDAARVTDAVAVLAGLLDAKQHAVANAGGVARPRPARHEHADFRRGAVRLLVPLGRLSDQLAVGIARAAIGEPGGAGLALAV